MTEDHNITSDFLFPEEERHLKNEINNKIPNIIKTGKYSPSTGYNKQTALFHIFVPKAFNAFNKKHITTLPDWFYPVLEIVNAKTISQYNYIIITDKKYKDYNYNNNSTILSIGNKTIITNEKATFEKELNPRSLFFYNSIKSIKLITIPQDSITLIFKQANTQTKINQMVSEHTSSFYMENKNE